MLFQPYQVMGTAAPPRSVSAPANTAQWDLPYTYPMQRPAGPSGHLVAADDANISAIITAPTSTPTATATTASRTSTSPPFRISLGLGDSFSAAGSQQTTPGGEERLSSSMVRENIPPTSPHQQSPRALDLSQPDSQEEDEEGEEPKSP